jgi:phosphodiesterase/alkaline phosphatase D-like protein
MTIPRCKAAILLFFFCGASTLFFPAQAAAQTLSIGSASGQAGGTVDLTVTFNAGSTGVSSMQFDLTLPSSLTYSTVAMGTAAANAGKTASANAISGGVRFVVFGLNQNTIPTGAIAVVRFNIAAGTSTGTVAVPISGMAACDPSGGSVGLTGSGAVLTITSSTDSTAPVISAIGADSITGSGATISWSTNEPATTRVEYGTSTAYGTMTTPNSALVTSHTQALSGLSPSTNYHYRVRSTDGSGNAATSSDYTFTTVASSDTTPPVIGSVSASASSSAAVVSWTTSESSDAQVEYGTTAAYGSLTVLNSAKVTSHTQSIGNLTPGTLYHYRVRSRDAAGNLAMSADYTFTTAAGSDTTPPVITGIGTSAISASSTIISWTTNEASDSQVEFGTSSTYGSVTPLNSTPVLAHSQTLTGLAASTSYHYRVKSRDAAGNSATSSDFTFKTSSGQDTTPPVISGVVVSGITYSGATLTWTTNEPADTQVEYGTGANYGQATALRPPLLATHSEALSGLNPKTTYHFRVKSKDAAGNAALSGDLTFKTAERTGDTAATLFYPLILGGTASSSGPTDSQYVGLALTNLDSIPATLTFTAYGPSGQEVSGPSISNPVTRVLNPSEQLPVVDTQLFGDAIQESGSEGWIRIESNAAKVAGFFLMFNDGLTELDGANVSSQPMSSLILPEVEDQGFTRVDIANPTADALELKFELVHASGNTAQVVTRTLGGNGAVVSDLFTDIFPGTIPAATDYVRISAPKGILGFEWLGKPAQYSEGLNGQDTQGGATTLYSPQFAVGGPWRSTLSVINLDGAAGNVTFRFIRDDATQVGATKVLPIAPYGKIYIDNPAFFQGLYVNPSDVVTQGYVEIVSNGVRLTGSVVFGDPARSVFSAALPLVDKLQNSILFSQVASDRTYFTGIAILNPGTTDATVTVDLYASDGRKEASATKRIPGRQRRSQVLTEFFPEMSGKERSSGYIRVSSDQEIAAFAVFGTNDLSVLSAVPPQELPR